MESLTKRRITESELAILVRHAFAGRAEVKGWRELADGSYNAAYAVTLDDGTELILKIAPPPELKLLTHEVDLMHTEADFYRRAAAAGVAVPRVLHAGFDRGPIGTDFIFLSRVDGVALNTVAEQLEPAELASVRRQAAARAARLHTVTGPAYGYPLRGSRSWQHSWRAAFGAMLADILDDAARLGRRLPAPPERFLALVRRHADLLDEVDRPALVHFDLWDGNVFVRTDAPGGARVTGFIDGERALYGDPVAELVSLLLRRDLEDEPEILDGYNGAGHGRIEPTRSVRRRLDLYTCYLYLIMLVEGATRGWSGPERDQVEAWLSEQLAVLLDRLA
ncbi:aminoglycoside phosphotransferase family protein [Micromonospora sp. NPDC049559]|uniref:phosphotransferase family protein n=1 Tax=Micromonospora sp. NPDC049559 TaxID=3155923 RepID=UPI00341CC17B